MLKFSFFICLFKLLTSNLIFASEGIRSEVEYNQILKISKEIKNSAFINSTSGKALLVSSYVIQTTLIVDGIFIFLAIIQPTLSGLV